MTKKNHRCDENCKVNHTTDYAKKNRLPSGSTVVSTKESSDSAYDKQVERLRVTKKFKEKYKKVEEKPKLKKKVIEKIRIPLAELNSIAENTNNLSEIALEVEKALIRMRRIEAFHAD